MKFDFLTARTQPRGLGHSATLDSIENAELLTKAVLSVEGMMCVACVNTVTNSLLEFDGVKRCEVSLKDQTAVVWYESQNVEETQLCDHIGDVGFVGGVLKVELPGAVNCHFHYQIRNQFEFELPFLCFKGVDGVGADEGYAGGGVGVEFAVGRFLRGLR